MAKSLAVTLAELHGGAELDEATKAFGELLEAVRTRAVSGKLVLTITARPANKTATPPVESVFVGLDVELKLPDEKASPDFFYLAGGGELSRQHPLQNNLFSTSRTGDVVQPLSTTKALGGE